MNLQEQTYRIKQIMGINEQTDIISQYVSEPRLVSILKDIETTLGEKFTDKNFKIEAVKAFNKMKSESGCPDIFIKEGPVSYRSYEDQKNQFLWEPSQ